MFKLTRRLLSAALLLLLLSSLSACAVVKPADGPQKVTEEVPVTRPHTEAPEDPTVPALQTEAAAPTDPAQPAETAAPTEPAVPEEVRLFDLDPYSRDNFSSDTLYHSKKAKDGKGYQHEDCFILYADKRGNRYLRYELGGRYSTLTGSFYARDDDGAQLWVEFYNGDTLLYVTPKLNSEAASVDFTLDVSGVEYLTVRPRMGHFCSSMLSESIITDQFILQPGSGSGSAPTEPYLPDSCRLLELDPYSTDDHTVDTARYYPSIKDTAGFVHKNCYTLRGDKRGDNYVRWDLDGKYAEITGTLYTQGDNSGTLWLDFYDGETYLFSTPKLSKQQKSVTFSYDITGVKYLTVYPMQDKDDSFSKDELMIADAIVISR